MPAGTGAATSFQSVPFQCSKRLWEPLALVKYPAAHASVLEIANVPMSALFEFMLLFLFGLSTTCQTHALGPAANALLDVPMTNATRTKLVTKRGMSVVTLQQHKPPQ